MHFDSQALQALEVVAFDLLGAQVLSFADDTPKHEPSVRDRMPNPVPPVEAAPQAIAPNWTSLASSDGPLPEAISANWSRLATASLNHAAFVKIVRIASRPDGWRGAGSRSLRPGALRHFLESWARVRHASIPPQFALLPNGHLQALWTAGDRRRMDLEYTETNRVYFGLLNGRHSHEGVEALNAIEKLLLAHPSRPLMWGAQNYD